MSIWGGGNRDSYPSTRGVYLTNIGTLLGGAAGAQILMLAASPILTRLYTPEDFGLLAVFVALLSALCVLSTLRYELAIPLPKTDEDAASVVALSLIVVVAANIAAASLIFLFGESLFQLINIPGLYPYAWMIPFGSLLFCFFNVLNFWAIRKKCFAVISMARIWQVFITLLIQLSAHKLGVLALMVGQVVGQGVGGGKIYSKAIRAPEFRSVSISSIKRNAVRYRAFPLYSSWSGLSNVLSLHLPPIIFASLFGASFAGFYALANRVLAAPIALIGDAVAKVFLSDAPTARRENRLGNLVERTHLSLVCLAMLPFVLMAVLSPALFPRVFGDSWLGAGIMASWMSPWLFMVFSVSPLSILYEVLEKQHYGVIFHITLLLVRLLAILFGALYIGDIYITVAVFSLASFVCWFALLMWIFNSTTASWKRMMTVYLLCILASLVAGYCIYQFVYVEGGSHLWLVLGGVVATLYGIFSIRFIKYSK